MITTLFRRLFRAIRRHGILGTLRTGAEQAFGFAKNLRPSVLTGIREAEQRAVEFDKHFGVDTGGFIHPSELRLQGPNQLHAVSYRGSDPKDFHNTIAALPIDYRRFVLIDFGSGKGRAILLATNYPFKRIVGLEFSEELHKIAQSNIARFRRTNIECEDVESICVDVVEYALPDDPLVCYFCNPFDAILMAEVIAKIRNSFLQHPRDIFIVYYNPKEGYLFDQTDCFKPVSENDGIRVWRAFSPSDVMNAAGSLC